MSTFYDSSALESKPAFGPANSLAQQQIVFVHPSEILNDPDKTDPHPEEVDNYPLVMKYLRDSLFSYAKKYKQGAFKDRLKLTMTMQKVFKMMIGSTFTTPTEKDVLRRAVDWTDYLDSRFGGLARLSRWHSMLYNGVFEEKVFRVFHDDADVAKKKEDMSTQPCEPVWGLVDFGTGHNDQISVGVDWNIIRTPRNHQQVFGKYTKSQYMMKLTVEGDEMCSAFGSIKKLRSKKGVVNYTVPPEKPVYKGEKFSDKFVMDRETHATIQMSWLSEGATRQRKHSGQYGIEELRDNAIELPKLLGRIPTSEEIFLDVLSCLMSDKDLQAEIEKKLKEEEVEKKKAEKMKGGDNEMGGVHSES